MFSNYYYAPIIAKRKEEYSLIFTQCCTRKSIVAAKAIKKGEILTAENLTVKRPGSGISPMKWYEILGSVAEKDFEIDELIEVTGE